MSGGCACSLQVQLRDSRNQLLKKANQQQPALRPRTLFRKFAIAEPMTKDCRGNTFAKIAKESTVTLHSAVDPASIVNGSAMACSCQ